MLSWILMRRLSKEQVWLYIRVIPDGVFHLSEDMSPTNITFQMATAGFEHNLPDLDQVGTVALTRVEWEPVSKGLPVRCKVKYALRSSSRRGRALARLVHLDASVKAVELS
ncbi:hypothetical protein N798_16625 [Knoellia flava TL1]|uniref:Uncharacterized protein n=1 Tax=Knoellia flava TL1 TaxID=1385518 RepID=A0ABR4X9P1_9MICO|nr:hypothetical protein N798_16625 [Knoellia flava TL1]